MTDAVAAYDGFRSGGRPAFSFGRFFALIASHVFLAMAAAASVGLAAACVLLTAAWVVSTMASTETGTSLRVRFMPRSIALVPRFPNPADIARAADIIVFPSTFEQSAARPVSIATRALVPEPVTSAPLPHSGLLAPSRDGARVPLPPLPPVRIATAAPEMKLAASPAPARIANPASGAKLASLPPRTSQPAPPPAASKPTETRTPDGRTAVYNIAAHMVYLPDGEKLEAHSGLGRWRDNPRYASMKMRGPTPPNVYELSLRGHLFHGVRAIRLTPVDDDKMFGRAGMLAHTYMLGPEGDSNGCVSFKNYQAFLQAYLKGEVDRLIVVPGHAAMARVTPSDRNADLQVAAVEH